MASASTSPTPESGANEPAPDSAAKPTALPPITDRLKKVLGLRMDQGALKKNTFKASQRSVERYLLARIHSFLRRPIDVEDVTPDLAEMFVKQWHREGMKIKSIRLRTEWFDRVNAVANAMGLQERFDFSEIGVLRGWDPTKSRQGQPIPETPSEAKRGRPSHLKMTLVSLLDDHYAPERLTGKSPNTVRLYKHSINAYSRHLGRSATVGDLNTKTISAFLDFLLTGTKLARATIQKDRTQLVALWNWAAKKGWLAEFPQIASVNVPDRLPDSWSDDELKALVKACEAQTGMIGDIPASQYWLALLSVVHDTAERIGALLQTAAADLDPSGCLTVRGEHRKGSKRDKRYRLQPITVERLKAIRRPGVKLLFPWPYSYGYIFGRFGKVLDSAGLPNNRRTKFHKIRRTTASNLEAAGGNATELLDHANRSTTKKSYLNPAVLKSVQPADVLAALGEDAAIIVQPEAGQPDSTADGELLAKLRDLLGKAS